MPDHRGRLRSSLHRWANASDDEARDLRRSHEESGLQSIDEAPDRTPVTVQGTLKTVTLRPRGGVPALEAELFDGSGSLLLVFLGRRRIAGIFPGQTLRVSGRIGIHAGHRLMFNPRYELRAG